ncbi:hypothetical protein [Chitinophaga solisilvae]|uniref:Uncharacterized protein n=1 Tax=Chitinophaga solisilvae TaxID=1233460 RepID=A0A3S1CZE2_9BACT|nr:hypothetical protein [Chitinophaga solisilvae]NSL87893.1 hypothetical protein [Chitinophaga solisilvae]
MENNKSISKKMLLSGSLVAAAILGFAASQPASANPVSYHHMGTGEAVRSALTGNGAAASAMELACGAKKDSAGVKKGKEGKCGEGKCGEGKCGTDKKKGEKKGGKGHKPKSDTTKGA